MSSSIVDTLDNYRMLAWYIVIVPNKPGNLKANFRRGLFAWPFIVFYM